MCHCHYNEHEGIWLLEKGDFRPVRVRFNSSLEICYLVQVFASDFRNVNSCPEALQIFLSSGFCKSFK